MIIYIINHNSTFLSTCYKISFFIINVKTINRLLKINKWLNTKTCITHISLPKISSIAITSKKIYTFQITLGKICFLEIPIRKIGTRNFYIFQICFIKIFSRKIKYCDSFCSVRDFLIYLNFAFFQNFLQIFYYIF